MRETKPSGSLTNAITFFSVAISNHGPLTSTILVSSTGTQTVSSKGDLSAPYAGHLYAATVSHGPVVLLTSKTAFT
jgi:hypothetical protein